MALFKRVHIECPHDDCDWSADSWTVKGAVIEKDFHVAICRKRPVGYGNAPSGAMVCRFHTFGCSWQLLYSQRDEEKARRLKYQHELSCDEQGVRSPRMAS